jgi:hypothetical protein
MKNFLALLLHSWLQFWLIIDQAFNWILSPLSFETWADETISSRCGRLGHRYPYKVYEVIIDVIFYCQEWRFSMGHCKRATEKEKLRTQLPPSLRG